METFLPFYQKSYTLKKEPKWLFPLNVLLHIKYSILIYTISGRKFQFVRMGYSHNKKGMSSFSVFEIS